MRQNVPLRKSGSAEAETDRASRSIDEWLDAAVAEQARRSAGRAGDPAGAAAASNPAPSGDADGTSERIPARTAAKPSAALGSMTSWIERAQEELAEVGKAPLASSTPAPSSSYDALSAVERLDTGLGPDLAHSDVQAAQEEAFRTLENRIREIAGRIDSPKNAPRPKAASRPLEEAVAEIRARQAALDEASARNPAMHEPAPAAAPAVRAAPQPEPATESFAAPRSDVGGSPKESARPASSASLPPGLEPLRRDIDRVHGAIAALATRSDIGGIERAIEALASEITEIRASGRSLVPAEAEVEALQAEVERLAVYGRIPAEGLAQVAREIDIVSHKLDIVAASGMDSTSLDGLGRELAEVKAMLGAMGSPADTGSLNAQLNELRLELAEIGSRQVDAQDFTSLRLAFEEMRDALSAGSGFPAAAPSAEIVQRVARDELQPIASMLVMLIEKIERLERDSADPDLAEQLERQIAGLSATIGSTAARDPGLADLSQAMADLMNEVAGWRDGTVEIAEHAARQAVAQTIEAMRGEFAPPSSLQAQPVPTARIEQPSATSPATHEDSRAPAVAGPDSHIRPGQHDGSTEAERPEPPREVTDAALRRLNEALLLSPALTEADRPVPRAPENEVLLEPGAGRPRATHQPLPEPEPPADGRDIKASFIAAARRAAQAAAADAEKAKGRGTGRGAAAPAGNGQGSVRLRGMLDRLRRPLLVSAAALVVAIGGYRLTVELATNDPAQVIAGRNLPAATSVATAPVITAPPASKVAAAPPPAAELPEPTTTATLSAPRPSQASEREASSPAPAAPAPEAVALEPRPTPAPAAPPAAASAETGSQKQVSQLPPAAPGSASPKPAATTENTAAPAAMKQAALPGDAAALYELAVRTMEGRGVPRDPRAAVTMFEKAGEKNLAPAQYRAGNAYEKGLGVPRDVEAARRWYQRAAENGNTRAMHNLAVLMAEGAGGKPDYAGAMTWFLKAAEHGVRDSQFNLAVLFARGLGTQQDLVRSYGWFAIAAGQGDDEAARKRDEVAARLQPADLARAKANVERWRVTPPSAAANEVSASTPGLSSDMQGKRSGRA